VTVRLQRRKGAKPFTVHIDKVKHFMVEHPRPWIESETPCDEDDQLATAEVLSDEIETAATAPRARSPVGSPTNLEESYDDSAGYSVDEATPFDRPTRSRKPPRYLDEYVQTTRGMELDCMEANQQSDLARIWEDRLRSGHSYEFVRSSSDQHNVSMNSY